MCIVRYLLLLFSCSIFSQQVPIDSISYDYFYGKELQTIVQLKKENTNKPFNAINQLQIAELYESINCEDSAYATFYKVFETEKDSPTLSPSRYKLLLFQLHETESSKHNYNRDRRFFLNLLRETIKNKDEEEWQAKIANEIAKDNVADSSKYESALKQFKNIQKSQFYNENQEFKTSILLNIGHTYTNLKQFNKANDYLNQCLIIANNNKRQLYQIYANINLAVNELQQDNYNSALIYLNQIDQIQSKKFKIKILRIYYQLKGDAYYGLKDSINLKYSDAYYNKLDSVINDFRKNSNFYEIDIRHQVKEKDAKIEALSGIESQFKKHRVIYGLLIFVVFVLALYSFVRWKKVDRRKRILAKENEENITELEHVKALVTQDYIVLKNKSKVYLDELIYVKSDGHYLNLFTENKKEFVRGKISEIQNELPPNFVKCHRSYIINKNFIKQFSSTEVVMLNGDIIPLSRNFKLE